MKYLLGIFFGNITFVVVANALTQPYTANEPAFNIQIIGLTLLAVITILWMYKVNNQMKKFNQELSTYLDPGIPE